MNVYLSPFRKPAHSSVCNSCGFCCAVQPCGIATEFLGAGAAGTCPALEVQPDTGGLVCGMIVRPLHYLMHDELRASAAATASGEADVLLHNAELSKTVALALGAGKGCDSDDDAHSQMWPWQIKLGGSR